MNAIILPQEAFSEAGSSANTAPSPTFERRRAGTLQFIREAHAQYGERLVMTSSAGAQSAALFQLVKEAGLSIPVVIVDIAGPGYEEQRAHTETLRNNYCVPVHVFTAANENDKKAALNRGLESLGAGAYLEGVHRDQTEFRATLDFIDAARNGPAQLRPVLEWSKAEIREYIRAYVPEHVQHPVFKKGGETKNGQEAQGAQLETECDVRFDEAQQKMVRVRRAYAAPEEAPATAQ